MNSCALKWLLALAPLMLPFSSIAATEPAKHAQLEAIIKRTQMLNQQIAELRQQLQQAEAQKRQQQALKLPLAAEPKPSAADVLMADRKATPVLADIPAKMGGKLTSTTHPAKLLQIRQKQQDFFKKQRIKPYYPIVQVGGNLIGSASLRRSHFNKTASDANLAAASLSVAAEFNPWVTGLMKFNYDAGGYSHNTRLPNRIGNSRVLLNTGMITVGNLEKSPLYFSIGQMVVPFGQYGSLLPNLTSRLGKTLARPLVLGYQQPGNKGGWNAAIYGFKGETRIYPNDRINNGGIKLGYVFNSPTLKIDTGASVIANIADSAGMQNTRAPFALFDDWTDALDEEDIEDLDEDDLEALEEEGISIAGSFAGFGKSRETEIIEHRVPALDVYNKLTIRGVNIYVEYTGATRSFHEDDLTFNNSGARPEAFNVEASYQFKLWNHLSVASIGYSRSYQALALNMPEQTVACGVRTLLSKHLMAGLVYRYDRSYGRGNYATGKELPVLSDSTLGRSSSSLTAQFGFKF